MGFFSDLMGKSQAKAAKRAAGIVSKAETENKNRAIETEGLGLADLDSALGSALGEYNAGQAGATEALQPYADTGAQSLSVQADLMGLNGPEAQAAAQQRFQTDPGYQFRLSQGVGALDQSATARGGLYSGAAMKALTKYGQDMGSQEYDNYYGRLSDLSGRGQDAATNISSTLSNFANQKASALLGAGQNKATYRANMLPQITGANTGAATATATGIKQAADAKAAGAGNLLSGITSVGKMLSGWA